jgi:hypothetical protein
MTAPYEATPVQRSSGGGLAEIVDLILDKGLVIDAFVRVSLVGIELITIDARIVVASVDTYLRFAEATNRLQLGERQDQPSGLAESLPGQRPGARGIEDTTRGVIDRASDTYEEEPLDHRRERWEAGRPSRHRRPAPRGRDS